MALCKHHFKRLVVVAYHMGIRTKTYVCLHCGDYIHLTEKEKLCKIH